MSRTASTLLLLSLSLPTLPAQDPVPAPPTPQKASPAERLRVALVENDGGRRTRMTEGADAVVGEGGLGIAPFLALRARLAAAGPAPASRPADPAAAPPKPPEIPADQKDLLNKAATVDVAASAEAIAALKALGAAAEESLRRLDERSLAVLGRLVSGPIKARMATGAIFAGQYSFLKEFGPETPSMLARWAAEPPRDVSEDVENFKGAAVRALRDVHPEGKGSEAVMRSLLTALQKSGRNQDLQLHIICVLKHLGEPRFFDQVKEGAEKATKGEKDEERAQGWSSLATLHYNDRNYELALSAYKGQIEILEAKKEQASAMYNVYYNACCTGALAKKPDEAFALLEKALVHGVKSEGSTANLRKLVEHDMDIESLRADPRFAKLVETHLTAPKSPGAKPADGAKP